MPISAELPGCDVLLDTSAAVALVVSDHPGHSAVSDLVGDRAIGLAGHAWFETHSVLTRLPGALRRTPPQVARLLVHNFPGSRFLSPTDHRWLAAHLAELDVAGGAVYDALVAAVARRHDLPLLSRDQRALRLYRAFEIRVEMSA